MLSNGVILSEFPDESYTAEADFMICVCFLCVHVFFCLYYSVSMCSVFLLYLSCSVYLWYWLVPELKLLIDWLINAIMNDT